MFTAPFEMSNEDYRRHMAQADHAEIVNEQQTLEHMRSKYADDAAIVARIDEKLEIIAEAA